MYIVTGGAGFIGSNVVAALANGGGEVVVCDNLGVDERWRNISTLAIADLVNPDRLSIWMATRHRRVTAVIHMGAVTDTTETNAELLAERNVRATLRWLDWCTKHQIPFIYASSAATYGDGSAGFDDDPSPAALAQLRPLNAYAWSKHVVDRIIAERAASGAKLPPQWVGLKFFNVYGPNELHKGRMASVIAQNFERLRAGEPMRLFKSQRPDYPDGGQLRDFVYVRDCVQVIEWLLRSPGVSGLFNLGSGQARSWRDLALAMFDALNLPPKIDYVEMPAALANRYQYFTLANMKRLRAAGYAGTFTDLESGTADYCVNHLLRGTEPR